MQQNLYAPQLIVYTGPMWSGKSRMMNGQLEIGLIAHVRVLLVRPKKDTRVIRSGSAFSGDTIIVWKAQEIFDHPIDEYEWIGFDELQQFDDDVIDVFKRLLRMGKRVLCAGLDQDFKEDPFLLVARAMALADHVFKLKSVCAKCRSLDGTRSQRLSDNQEVEDIGGEEKYEPRCFLCYVPPNGVVHAHNHPLAESSLV